MYHQPAVKPARARFSRFFRAQVLLIWSWGVLLPLCAIAAFLRQPILGGHELDNSAIAGTLSIFCAIIFVRKVTSFPGVSALGYVLPTFAGAYAAAIAGLFAARIDYSNAFIFTSFVMATGLAFAYSYWQERSERRRFYLVPSGRINEMLTIEGVEWAIMTSPALPLDARAVIVADLHADHEDAWERMLATAALQGHPVYHTKQIRESLTGRVSIEHLSENSFGSLLPNLAYRKVKRLIDIGVCVAIAPVIAAPMLAIALAVRVDSRGPALFTQKRVGYRGRHFVVYKFRSMRAEDVDHQSISAAMTQNEDHRITKVGRFLRRSRLDELPQLFNVLRGDMSLIGPRPEAVPLSEWYDAELPFYTYRHIVRPGLTGWAQVNQGHVSDLGAVHVKLHYDFYYIKNFSAWIDILIALRTIPIVFSGFGSK